MRSLAIQTNKINYLYRQQYGKTYNQNDVYNINNRNLASSWSNSVTALQISVKIDVHLLCMCRLNIEINVMYVPGAHRRGFRLAQLQPHLAEEDGRGPVVPHRHARLTRHACLHANIYHTFLYKSVLEKKMWAQESLEKMSMFVDF